MPQPHPHGNGGGKGALKVRNHSCNATALMWQHWTARACTPIEPFLEFESASRCWRNFEESFPEMIAGVLMPNHLHLILPGKATKCTRRKLYGFLGGISRRTRIQKLWQPIPSPHEIPDVFHLRRQIRYVALNPCRKNLCNDPLEWYWSTYRAVLGASAESPQSPDRLAEILGESPRNFKVRFHAYVSGDPSVSITGTSMPQPALPKKWSENGIGEILTAAAAALRLKPSQVGQKRSPLRGLFIHLAYRHGWQRPDVLARICGISTCAVHQTLRKACPPGLSAAELCLGDKRLRVASPIFNFYSNIVGGQPPAVVLN